MTAAQRLADLPPTSRNAVSGAVTALSTQIAANDEYWYRTGLLYMATGNNHVHEKARYHHDYWRFRQSNLWYQPSFVAM
jgi:hypothetical protein